MPMPPCTSVEVRATKRPTSRGQRLGVGGHQRGLGRRGVEGVGGVPDQRAAGLQLGGHLGAQVLHRLERADHPAELPALLGVGHRLVEHHLGRAQACRRRAAPSRRRAGAASSCRRAAGQRLGRDVVEGQLRRAGASRRSPASGSASGPPRRRAPGAGRRPCRRRSAGPRHAARHEQRLAGELAVLGRRRPRRPRAPATASEIAAAGDRPRRTPASAATPPAAPPSPPRISASGASTDAQERHRRDRRAQRLRRQRRVQQRQAQAAVLLRDHDARQAEARPAPARRRRPCRSRSPANLRTRSSGAGVGERAVQALLHHLLVGGEREIHGSGHRRLRLARHAEAAFGDDVLLDLRRAAADDQAEVEHVAPTASAPLARRCGPSS